MKDSPHIFISYSNHDVEVAEQLAMELVNIGVDVWFDKWRIKGGDSIVESVDAAIDRCQIFIVLLSKHALKSKWVTQETSTAFQRKLNRRARAKFKIVPIRVDDCEIPARYRDLHTIDYSSDPSVLLPKLLPIIAPELESNPTPLVQTHTREQVFDKAITVLRLQPVTLRTTMVGPIFLNSEAMVQAKQVADSEKRPSVSLAIRSFLLRQLSKPTSEVSIVIKLIPRYERILENIAESIDIRVELARIREDLDLFFQDSEASNIKYAVSREYQYSFMVSDKILLEPERYSTSDKMREGWSTTQPKTIQQKTRMFDAAFERIYRGNLEAKASLSTFFDDFERRI